MTTEKLCQLFTQNINKDYWFYPDPMVKYGIVFTFRLTKDFRYREYCGGIVEERAEQFISLNFYNIENNICEVLFGYAINWHTYSYKFFIPLKDTQKLQKIIVMLRELYTITYNEMEKNT